VSDEQEQPVVVNDRRRIDPETGQLREAVPGELADETIESAGRHAADEPVADPAAEFKAQLDERTADLQRLQAEYANYRKRVERDREINALAAKGQIAGELLSVLDDVERVELLEALKRAEADIKSGKSIDYEPKKFKDRLIGIYRRAKR